MFNRKKQKGNPSEQLLQNYLEMVHAMHDTSVVRTYFNLSGSKCIRGSTPNASAPSARNPKRII